MNKNINLNFLRKRFYSYYINPKIDFPKRFERREYAFILFGEEIMHRHISFNSKNLLLDYLKANVPMHAYYSSAYYQNPSADNMNEKKWMGADLIFDLDADLDAESLKNLTYEESLIKIKEELIKLLDFLIEDFGFSKKDIAIYFSGHRGYHCHVCNKRILELGSQERREIIDYIMARGLELKEIVEERYIYRGKYVDKTIKINPNKGGWAGRLSKAIIEFFNEIRKMDEEKAIKELMKIEGIGEKIARKIYDMLHDKRKMERIKQGRIDQATEFKKIIKPLIKEMAISLYSQTDEPVTADIKRLIRLPGSLHGKTGLRVAKVDKIEEFEPLINAIAFGDDLIKIKVEKPFKIRMMENEFKLNKGIVKVPEYVAIFAIAKKFATHL